MLPAPEAKCKPVCGEAVKEGQGRCPRTPTKGTPLEPVRLVKLKQGPTEWLPPPR